MSFHQTKHLPLVLLTAFVAAGSLVAAPITVASYDMLNGQSHSYSYRDKSYNGSGDPLVSLSNLSGGTGLLTDGVLGATDFTANLGNGPAYEWVGWARDPGDGNNQFDFGDTRPVITFHFSSVQALNSIALHVNNFGAPLSGIGVFDTATITFSNDGINFGNAVTYSTSGAEQADTTARFITIGLGQNSAQHVRVHLSRTSNWVFLSEVAFDSVDTTVNETPEPSTAVLGGIALAGLFLLRRKQ